VFRKKRDTIMRKTKILLLICLAIFTVACSSMPRIQRVEGPVQDLSGNWNANDVKIVCDTLIADAIASPRLSSFITTYQASHRGALPTVIVGRFRNTTSEHIDTTIITSIMRTSIINSGKLDFVEGGELRDDLRVERQDQQSNASEATAAALANETGAVFMLTGEVNSIIDRAGNLTVRTYYVTASLTEIETNRIIWEGQNNSIQKAIQQPTVRP
jgi:uncharacterized protein (TIGR02722 family)